MSDLGVKGTKYSWGAAASLWSLTQEAEMKS